MALALNTDYEDEDAAEMERTRPASGAVPSHGTMVSYADDEPRTRQPSRVRDMETTRIGAPSHPGLSTTHADARRLAYEARKLFLVEDSPDPGAVDDVSAPPSPAHVEGPASIRALARAPMTSAQPDFEGPRDVRHHMFSAHPDFAGPRGVRAQLSSLGRVRPAALVDTDTAFDRAETTDYIARKPDVADARPPLPSLHPPSNGFSAVPSSLAFAMSMPPRAQSHSDDGHGSWKRPASAETPRTNPRLDAKSSRSSAVVPAFTAIAALVVMVGVVLSTRGSTRSEGFQPTAETFPPTPPIAQTPVAAPTASASADPTPAPPASATALPQADAPDSAKAMAKKKTRKRVVAKPVEKNPPPGVDKALAAVQEEQLRRLTEESAGR